MRKVTKKDIDWVVNATFGKHTDPDKFIKTLPLRDNPKTLEMIVRSAQVLPHLDIFVVAGLQTARRWRNEVHDQ